MQRIEPLEIPEDALREMIYNSLVPVSYTHLKCKLIFITLDEKSGAEKKTSTQVLVQAADLRDAVKKPVSYTHLDVYKRQM